MTVMKTVPMASVVTQVNARYSVVMIVPITMAVQVVSVVILGSAPRTVTNVRIIPIVLQGSVVS